MSATPSPAAAVPRRRAKIVCTLGPATSSPDRLAELVRAGMDVARLNFSHGDHADHEKVYRTVREVADRAGRAVGILADLQGPKIRLGRFAAGPVTWRTSETVRITVDDIAGTPDRVSTTYKGLADDARPGDRLLVDDGKVALEVADVEGSDVVCTVTVGGTVSDNKGVSLPGMNVSVPALSGKDIADLEFALGLGVDLVALSFVRSPADIDLVHAVMDRVGHRAPVIAKLEKPEAVDELEAIVDAFDGIMVARGDLGVELALERVPLVQKRAIQLCRENAKPVIVATQMLDSMIANPRPTRAEASDVANAVLDGADALMLSGETSVGDYPIETVQTMARIIEEVESDPMTTVPALRHLHPHPPRPHHPGGPRHRRRARRQGARGVHAVRRHRPAAGPPPPSPPHPRVHAGAVRPQPAGTHVGHRDVPRPAGRVDRRAGAAGRPGAAVDGPVRRERRDRADGRLAAGDGRLDEPPARPPPRHRRHRLTPPGQGSGVR